MPRSKMQPGRDSTRRSAPFRRDLLPQVQLEFALVFSVPKKSPGRDRVLESLARELLLARGAKDLASKVRVEWSSRLRSAAGRAEYARAWIVLNCRLCEHGEAEIDRTLRHEVAHLLAHARAGRRRIAPHGKEWRRACAELGIAGEARCHNLPLPIRRQRRRYVYHCPNCRRGFPRTRPLRRTSACFACCRAFNHGRYDARFKLRLVRP